ncbi:MAG: hypothetical protein AAFW81_06145 [Pseudomonadota bacterium]
MSGLREIAFFYDPEEAYCALAYIRSHDLPVYLFGEGHLNINPALRVALGGYRMVVPAGEAKTARSLLAHAGANFDLVEAQAGSYEPVQRTPRNWLSVIVAFHTGIPFLWKASTRAIYIVQLIIILLMLSPFVLSWGAYLYWLISP